MRLTDEQIGAELYALRPTPSEDFAARLDTRAAAGFPAARAKAGNRTLTWGRLGMVLAPLAGVAVVAVVLANSGSGGGGTYAAREATPSVAPSGGPPEVAGAGKADLFGKQAARVVQPSTPAPPNGARPRNGRAQIQELSAALGLSTDAGKLQGAADGVVQVTDRYSGGSDGHASFTLRIPAADLRDALDDLSGLGRVVSRDEGSANVTGAYVDAGKAFREARAKVDSLVAKLGSASSPTEAAAIRQQLITARQELAAARTALRSVKQRVTYAPVSVQIRADGDGNWSIGDAADDAVGVLEAIAGAALIMLAVLVPLAALLALGWLGARDFSRRRREATLDRT
jgi:hypothetical protein